jgi:hypothetical protein
VISAHSNKPNTNKNTHPPPPTQQQKASRCHQSAKPKSDIELIAFIRRPPEYVKFGERGAN